MENLLELDQKLRLNPYVAQAEKLSHTLQYLAQILQKQEVQEGIADARSIEYMEAQVERELCHFCKEREMCALHESETIQKLIRALIQEIDEYGVELSVRRRREWEKKCGQFKGVQERIEKNLRKLKSNYLWEGKIAKSKEASVVIMNAFVKSMEESTRELDASIFRDEHLERKLCNQLQKIGVRVLKVLIFVSLQGQFEVQITAKAKTGMCVTTKQMAESVSRVLGRKVIPEKKERFVMKEEYDTVIFIEKPKYQMLYGTAKQTKWGSEVSGDNFLIMDVSGGKKCAMISDGMGSGQAAYQESKVILELAEILLDAGMPEVLALETINAVLLTETSEVEFATLDLCIVDCYRGKMELLKAGATSTYIISQNKCAIYDAASLPMGVVAELEVNRYRVPIEEDCYIVMLTDGMTEGIPVDAREEFMISVVRESKTKNPKEIAERILEKALLAQKREAKDDMMVLVLGIWELQF